MRIPLTILLGLELLVAVALGQIGHVNNPDMARTWMAWRNNPTAETRQAFEHEQRITEIHRWVFAGAVFAVLGGATVLVYRIRRVAPGASGDAGRRA